uniref:Glycosyltransferase family 92 protein n=1 Tax=Parastrongyloides trichosuri TaxID=131310 RepID=A0A0N5A1H9_PARTI
MIKNIFLLFFNIFLSIIVEANSPVNLYGNYIFIANIIKGEQIFNKNKITLVLNSPSTKIKEAISEQLQSWNGPISFGIYIDTNDIFDLKCLCTYCKLKLITRNDTKTSVHFIFPKNALSNGGKNKEFLDEFFHDINCDEDTKLANHICDSTIEEEYTDSEDDKVNKLIRYPINIIKNIARSEVKTKYMLFSDINYFFSNNFESKMLQVMSQVNNFYEKRKAIKIKKKLKRPIKYIMVFKMFDVDGRAVKPRDKNELIKLILSKKAFIIDNFSNNSLHYKYEESWFKRKESQNSSIQYSSYYRDINWDPSFVSDNKIPYFDEKFIFPLNDNIELKWHLCRMEYKFIIIDDIFMFKYGISNFEEDKIISKAKYKIMTKSFKIIKDFNKKMLKLYPKTVRTCPKFHL